MKIASAKDVGCFRSAVDMIRNEGNVIRPRRNHRVWTNSGGAMKINNRPPIFKIGENDFSVKLPNGEPQISKKTSENKSKSHLMHQISNYCDKTTLHGLRYVGDRTLSLGERVFWCVAFLMAVGFATYFISKIYDKWNASPVIISFSPFDADISAIPFPAVTICNMNQAKKTEAERILRSGSTVEKMLLDDYCNINLTFNSKEQIKWDALKNYLVSVGSSCSDILKQCKWKSETVNCDEIFNNDLTDEGLCCSFNRLPPHLLFRNSKDISILNQTYPSNVYDWNPEKGFPEKDDGDENVIPRRPLGSGAHLGLSVVLDAAVDSYFCSSTRSIGFKVMLSNPIETPKMADFGFLLSPGLETRIVVDPSIREATPNLRGVSIAKRQCYFSNERPLKYYRSYSQNNCNQECHANYTLQQCACVPYYLPKDRDTKYCGKNEEACADKAKKNIELSYGNASSCHCLPGCHSMSFGNSRSFAALSENIQVNDELKMNFSTKYFKKNMVVAHFYFQKTKFVRSIKSELYGFTDILSNIGGLLGLCMGFSFLSFIELLYFTTLRLFCIYANAYKKTSRSSRL